MNHVVAVSMDGVRIPLSARRVSEIARAVLASQRIAEALLSVTFVTSPAMREMNRRHLGRDRPTDVIAFAFRPIIAPGRRAPRAIVGDVYIAPDEGRASALEAGVPVREELTRLIVHGTLHVLGLDHPETGDRTRCTMWRAQERLVSRLMPPR